MRAVMIRHGESTGNLGIPCDDHTRIELTERGWEQARNVAMRWTERPHLIVTSPYLRARQTAQPTATRFAEVPVEVWPIEEFSYLQAVRWNGTTSQERLPYIEHYWERMDPDYSDGPGAESFRSLLDRAERMLARLQTFPEDTFVCLFSHGQFIQAVRSLVVEEQLSDREKMSRFWNQKGPAVANAELVPLRYQAHGRGFRGFTHGWK